jgi:hypothetical protein
LYREIGVTYSVYPCSSSDYQIGVNEGMDRESAGFTIDNPAPLWYNETSGKSYPLGMTEDGLPTTIKMALESGDNIGYLFVSSNNCCPVTAYALYDLSNTAATTSTSTGTGAV